MTGSQLVNMASPIRCVRFPQIYRVWLKIDHKLIVGRSVHTTSNLQTASVENVIDIEPSLTHGSPPSVDSNAVYPEIKPKYPPSRWHWGSHFGPHAAWKKHEEAEAVKSIPKAKERLEALAGPWDQPQWIYWVLPKGFAHPEGNLPFSRFITRTHIAKGLPAIYEDINTDHCFDDVKTAVIDALVQHQTHRHKEFPELRETSQPMTARHKNRHLQLVTIVRNVLSRTSTRHEHLLKSQVDYNVTVKAFWRRFFGPHEQIRAKYMKSGTLLLQCESKVDCQIRTELPLPQVGSIIVGVYAREIPFQ